MKNIINSSGVNDINSYNSISNNTTILSTFNVSGLAQLNSTTINSSLNVSGSTILNKLPSMIHCMFQDLELRHSARIRCAGAGGTGTRTLTQKAVVYMPLDRAVGQHHSPASARAITIVGPTGMRRGTWYKQVWNWSKAQTCWNRELRALQAMVPLLARLLVALLLLPLLPRLLQGDVRRAEIRARGVHHAADTVVRCRDGRVGVGVGVWGRRHAHCSGLFVSHRWPSRPFIAIFLFHAPRLFF
jgi:hypothetical protein